MGASLQQKWRVPFRVLKDGEAAVIRQQIAADPASAIALAQAAAPAGRAVVDALMREVGGSGPETGRAMRLAQLAADRRSAGFAAQAAEGMRLRAEGAPAAKFEDGEDLATARAALAPAFGHVPEVLNAAVETAEAAAAAATGGGLTPARRR